MNDVLPLNEWKGTALTAVPEREYFRCEESETEEELNSDEELLFIPRKQKKHPKSSALIIPKKNAPSVRQCNPKRSLLSPPPGPQPKRKRILRASDIPSRN